MEKIDVEQFIADDTSLPDDELYEQVTSKDASLFENDVSVGKKIKHAVPCLSLRKVYGFDKLTKSLGKLVENVQSSEELRVAPKVDGMTFTLQDGVMISRGDGDYGRLLFDSHTLDTLFQVNPTLKNLFTLTVKGEGVVRGEIFVKKSDLREGESNTRTTVVGLLNKNGVSREDLERLNFAVWSIPSWLSETAFDSARVFLLPSENVTEESSRTLTAIDKVFDDALRSDIPIDGLVFYIAKRGNPSLPLRHDSELHMSFYADAFAYKRRGECVRAVAHKIAWQMGSSGALTPVLTLKTAVLAGDDDLPVLGGKEIKYVTAHNVRMLARIKEKVRTIPFFVDITLAGEIIPHITNVERIPFSSDRIPVPTRCHIPSLCPFCESELEYSESGAELFCRNVMCEERTYYQLLRGLMRLGAIQTNYSQKVWNNLAQIMGSGETYIERLKSCCDLLRFPIYEISAETVLYALADSGEGRRSVQKTLQELWMTPENKEKIAMFEKVFSCRVKEGKDPVESRGKIAVTGVIEGKTRDTVVFEIQKKGFTFAPSVTKDTLYLIVGENAGNKKLEDAKSKAVKCLTWDAFLLLD